VNKWHAPKIEAGPDSPYESRAWAGSQPIAHNVVHRRCAEPGNGGRRALETGISARKAGLAGRCPYFAQAHLSLSNQGLCQLARTLRTILSTESVQNFGASLFFSLPCFCAW